MFIHILGSFVLGFRPSLPTALTTSYSDPQPTVTISNGIVIGTATGVLNQASVTGLANAYLGIPFAQSPPTRFSPPVASDPWAEPLLAQTLPNTCIQQLGEHNRKISQAIGL